MIIIFLILALASSQSHVNQNVERRDNSESKVVENQDEETLDKQKNEEKKNPVITKSAKGWNIKVGPILTNSIGESYPTTIVVNPEGKEFTIGMTPYSIFNGTQVWILEIKEYEKKFLIIHMYSYVYMTHTNFLMITEKNEPVLAADILTRRELSDDETLEYVAEAFFADSDGDGIRELVQDNLWKWGGYIIYHKFDGNVFKPLYIERYVEEHINPDQSLNWPNQKRLWRIKIVSARDIVNRMFGK